MSDFIGINFDSEQCVEAPGPRDRDGYVYAWDPVRKVDSHAHRVAWSQEHGPIPAGMEVMHSCDNPPCYNLAHLSLGTHADNVRDCWAKGRGGGAPIQRRSQTHCVHGHEFTPENTVTRPNGTRNCRSCKNARRRVNA